METLRRMIVIGGVIGIVVAVMMAVGLHVAFAQVTGPEGVKTETRTITEVNSRFYMAEVLGAALAAGFGFLGGGYAVARVGAAALGAASERPELLVRSLVFVALGEGIAIFGLVVAILLVLRLPA